LIVNNDISFSVIVQVDRTIPEEIPGFTARAVGRGAGFTIDTVKDLHYNRPNGYYGYKKES
ncbi:MAG: hypothetical protein ACUVTF_09760, partial [bacterium]